MVVLSYPNRMMTAAAASRICCWRSFVSDIHGLSFRHRLHTAQVMIFCAIYYEMWAEVKAEIRSTPLPSRAHHDDHQNTERAHLPPFLTEDAVRQAIGADRYAPDGSKLSPCPAALAA